jgi:hypothetical protein
MSDEINITITKEDIDEFWRHVTAIWKLFRKKIFNN